jgi:hypothetical protein
MKQTENNNKTTIIINKFANKRKVNKIKQMKLTENKTK